PLTIKNLENLDYTPKSRNKTIVDVLLRKRLMDKRGSGILRMKQTMTKWSLQKPKYSEKMGYFVIKFIGPYNETVLNISEKLNERQKKAIQYLQIKRKITTKEYIIITKTSHRTAKRDLINLMEKQIIKRIGSTKTGNYYLNGTVNGTVNGTINGTVNNKKNSIEKK
ncbi:MAG: DeoR family transcriptional regulator, partial [Nanohaloarchaea archaeon]|nr:DeoR family transcriptional regulator [Candidatus Nanohaloarchaea archaeon]